MIDIVGLGKRVQIFIDEADNFDHRSLYLAILEKLRAEGAAGATVVRGVAGLGAHSEIHSAGLVDIVSPLPLVITWVDAPDRVARILPIICSMVPEGLITVEDINIAKYAHRDLPALRPSLLVGELMTTEVTAAHSDTPLPEVVNLLIGRDFRALPVVDAGEQVVGIITNGDLIERGRLPARIELLSAMDPASRDVAVRRTATISASEVMTPNPVLIGPEQPIEEAAEVMLSRRLKRLPVVDADHRLRGMISRVDLLRALGEAYPRPVQAEPSPTRADAVADIMNRQPPVVREDALLAEVLDVVVSTRLNRAVVVDAEGRVLGVVSDADVLRRLDPHFRSGVIGALMNRGEVIPEAAGQATAREVMISPAITVTADVPVSEAARLIVAQRHKMLPVVDEGRRLLGIVDRAHLLRAAGRADSGQRA